MYAFIHCSLHSRYISQQTIPTFRLRAGSVGPHQRCLDNLYNVYRQSSPHQPVLSGVTWGLFIVGSAAIVQGCVSARTSQYNTFHDTWLTIRYRMKISIAIYCCISFLAQPYDCTHIHNRAPQIGELSRALLPTFVSSTWTLLCTTVQFGVSRTTRMGHTLYG